jgi:hypothetical protein
MRHSLLVTFFAFSVLGCGGPTREAQAALTITAHALVATDHEVAPLYTRAAEEAREHSTGWADYDAAMSDWNTVEAALRVAHAALLTTQAGLDAWRAGDERGWLASVPCLVVAVDSLVAGLQAVHVEVEALTQAVSLVRAFTGRCEP